MRENFMDEPKKIVEDIFYIGVNDLETEPFEGIWPLPQGVAYNSYIIKDKKTALIDTVKRTFFPQYLDKIRKVIGTGGTVDYLVVNHMEPDHSGSMKVLHHVFPNMQIVGNKKTVEFIKGFYGIDEGRIKVVDDGGSLELGARTLKFTLTPMVHWPETMVTYEPKEQVLFSGDAFGSFGTLNGGIFDDEVDLSQLENETMRYYSNIVAKYSPMVQKALARLKGVPIKVIASTHGAIFRKDPGYIVGMYDRMSRFEAEKGVVVIYASMYGNTQLMAEAVAQGAAEAGVGKVRLHSVSRTHLSYLLTDIWRYKGVALGSCAYNTKAFPMIEQLISTLDNDRLKNRVYGVFGSYSWSGGGVKALREYVEKTGDKLVEPVVEAKYSPNASDLEGCRRIGRGIAEVIA
jgi:flavorubredoxin